MRTFSSPHLNSDGTGKGQNLCVAMMRSTRGCLARTVAHRTTSRSGSQSGAHTDGPNRPTVPTFDRDMNAVAPTRLDSRFIR
jgi:hypothetical protein